MSETFTNNVILDKVEKGVSTEDLQNTYQKKDYTFAEEVNASWQLQWIGQAVQNEIDFQKYNYETTLEDYHRNGCGCDIWTFNVSDIIWIRTYK